MDHRALAPCRAPGGERDHRGECGGEACALFDASFAECGPFDYVCHPPRATVWREAMQDKADQKPATDRNAKDDKPGHGLSKAMECAHIIRAVDRGLERFDGKAKPNRPKTAGDANGEGDKPKLDLAWALRPQHSPRFSDSGQTSHYSVVS